MMVLGFTFYLSQPALNAAELNELEAGLPQIEARNYDVTVIRPSLSRRVYLFKLKSPADMPQVGRMFLVKIGQEPVMALRVLRIYPRYEQFAAKALRVYPGFEALETLAEYRLYERQGELADLKDDGEQGPVGKTNETKVTETGASKRQDAEDLSELETAEKLIAKLEAIDTTEDELGDRDFYPNAIILQPGSALTYNIGGASAFYAPAMNLAWRRNFISPIFRQKYPLIDGIAFEFGASYYRVRGNVDGVAKLYTVTPLTTRLLYQVPLSEKVILSLYTAVVLQLVPQTVGVTEEELQMAQGFYGTIGGGFWFELGPNWYLTSNLGLDFIGLGVALKF